MRFKDPSPVPPMLRCPWSLEKVGCSCLGLCDDSPVRSFQERDLEGRRASMELEVQGLDGEKQRESGLECGLDGLGYARFTFDLGLIFPLQCSVNTRSEGLSFTCWTLLSSSLMSSSYKTVIIHIAKYKCNSLCSLFLFRTCHYCYNRLEISQSCCTCYKWSA